jgi:transcriptional regulator with XRE-family HTH domain
LKYQTVGEFLKNARQNRNLSQWEVAKQLGYSSPQFISNIERGISPPPVETLKQFMVLYKISSKLIVEVMRDDYSRALKKELAKVSSFLK